MRRAGAPRRRNNDSPPYQQRAGSQAECQRRRRADYHRQKIRTDPLYAQVASAISPARRSSSASADANVARAGMITPVRCDAIGHGDVLAWPALRRTSKGDTIPRHLQSRSETPAPLPLGRGPRLILGLPAASLSGGSAVRRHSAVVVDALADDPPRAQRSRPLHRVENRPGGD
jgi:hypothetical protein